MAELGIIVKEQMAARNLELKYFTDSHYEVLVKMNETHILVTAQISGF